MNIQEIKNNLSNTGLKKVIYFPQLHSTNIYAKENKLESDCLVITSYQYEGRGRYDRIWESIENNNLTFTIVKTFDVDSKKVFILNFYTSYIILKAIKDIFPEYLHKNFTLKWPNDLLIKGKKFGGILSELVNLNEKDKKFIIGIGINVNQKEFPDTISYKATSLRLETGIIFELEDLLIRIVNKFYDNLSLLNDTDNLMKLWVEESQLLNKEIRFRRAGEEDELKGRIVEILNNGGIKIETIDVNTKNYSIYYSGEISFIY
jgi:BirA family transcriptional regulator, biotin operon repressor / biotin---[acetyl-CoA-carboxylase] ligase